MRDEQEGQPALLVEVPHQVDDLGRALAVEVAGRLVGPDDRRVVDQRPRDRDALALAARELVREVVGAAREVDEAERLERPLAGLSLRAARDQERQLDVLDGAQHGHQVVELEDEAHAQRPVVGALLVGHGGERRPLDEDVAGVDGVEAGEAVEERRLAAAARAHDRDHLAAGDREADAVEGVHLDLAGVVDLVDVPRLDEGRLVDVRRRVLMPGASRRRAGAIGGSAGSALRGFPQRVRSSGGLRRERPPPGRARGGRTGRSPSPSRSPCEPAAAARADDEQVGVAGGLEQRGSPGVLRPAHRWTSTPEPAACRLRPRTRRAPSAPRPPADRAASSSDGPSAAFRLPTARAARRSAAASRRGRLTRRRRAGVPRRAPTEGPLGAGRAVGADDDRGHQA